MTDDLERMRRALRASTPAPDQAVKTRALRAAAESFASVQGSQPTERPIGRTGRSLPAIKGVFEMLSHIPVRPALAAASGLAVVGMAIVMVVPNLENRPQQLAQRLNADDADLSASEDTLTPIARPITPAPLEESRGFTDQTVSKRMDETMAQPVANIPAPQATNRLRSVTDGMASAPPRPTMAPMPIPEVAIGGELARLPFENRERFSNEASSSLKITRDEPVSTLSVDVDTASYAFVRASLMGGYLPDPDAVRIEEMINYFPYAYPAPEVGDAPFKATATVFETPWNEATQIVHIGIQGIRPAPVEERPPLDLVFLIDTSGSMQDANKLPLLKQSFRLLLSRLQPQDRVAMVTYAGSAGLVLEPTAASNRDEIVAALDRLEAGGSTAGQAGLEQAYDVAESMLAEAGNEERLGRVILATDGDFNVGPADPDALKAYVEDKRDTGVSLSVLGFGRGNYHDALMQSLAQNGNGIAAYIDTLSEAQKVLVDQVAGSLFPIANDVKIQVEFNPTVVAEYRLIGYETRLLAREDFNNDRVDAGDIGAGHSVTALYEVTPMDSPAVLNTPLRYGDEVQVSSNASDSELGFLKLRYKSPGESRSQLIETPIVEDDEAGGDQQFATAIAGFGQLLRDDRYLGDWSYDDAIALAVATRGDDPFGYRAEAVNLMRLAQSLK